MKPTKKKPVKKPVKKKAVKKAKPSVSKYGVYNSFSDMAGSELARLMEKD